jgi:hypothetical protein
VTGTAPRTGAIAAAGAAGAPAVAGAGAWRGRFGAVNPGFGGWRGRHHRRFYYPYAAYPYALGSYYGSSYLYDDDYYGYGDYCRVELRRFVDRQGRVHRRRVEVCT